jgi:hypothetical protein
MKENHITDILDNSALASLSESELRTIRVHVETCGQCTRAYEAAQFSALLIKERAAEAGENSLNVNPFFQTRILAAWRERANEVSGLRRLWNATGALVGTMTATTAALAVMTFVVPSSEPVNEPTVALAQYSAEAVMLDQGDNEVSDDQVLSAIYADEDEGK